jgi:hypothetical protein
MVVMELLLRKFGSYAFTECDPGWERGTLNVKLKLPFEVNVNPKS